MRERGLMVEEMVLDNYDEIIKICKKKMRYGNLWSRFSDEELVQYGFIKAKRGLLLLQDGNIIKSTDDIQDAINILICSLLNIKANGFSISGEKE